MSSTRKPLILRSTVALAIVAVLSAACSNAPAGTDASSDGAGASAAREQAVKFADCMRSNGVHEFPDPDASGTLTIETVANGTSIDTDSEAFQRAIKACKDHEPPGFIGITRTPEQQQAALRFAQCIRDNGVKDFPDPGPADAMIDTNRIPSANRTGGMSVLHAAMEQCTRAARDAGVTGGE
jgi:hypothetical protein